MGQPAGGSASHRHVDPGSSPVIARELAPVSAVAIATALDITRSRRGGAAVGVGCGDPGRGA